MQIAEMVLGYLRVLLTGPLIAGAVATGFLVMFREPIRGVISRIASIKLPGGGELATPQLPPESRAEQLPLPPADAQQRPAPLNLGRWAAHQPCMRTWCKNEPTTAAY